MAVPCVDSHEFNNASRERVVDHPKPSVFTCGGKRMFHSPIDKPSGSIFNGGGFASEAASPPVRFPIWHAASAEKPPLGTSSPQSLEKAGRRKSLIRLELTPPQRGCCLPQGEEYTMYRTLGGARKRSPSPTAHEEKPQGVRYFAPKRSPSPYATQSTDEPNHHQGRAATPTGRRMVENRNCADRLFGDESQKELGLQKGDIKWTPIEDLRRSQRYHNSSKSDESRDTAPMRGRPGIRQTAEWKPSLVGVLTPQPERQRPVYRVVAPWDKEPTGASASQVRRCESPAKASHVELM